MRPPEHRLIPSDHFVEWIRDPVCRGTKDEIGSMRLYQDIGDRY